MKLAQEDGIVTLTPTTDAERIGLASLMRLKVGDQVKYLGRGPDYAEGFFTIRVAARKEGLAVLIAGDDDQDRYRVNDLRNICYFSTGLIYMGRQGDSVKITGGNCKLCGAQIVDHVSVEHKVCHSCYEKCDHELGEPGFVQGARGLDVKRYCEKCGRVPQDIITRIGTLDA